MTEDEKPTPTPRLNFANPAASQLAPEPVEEVEEVGESEVQADPAPEITETEMVTEALVEDVTDPVAEVTDPVPDEALDDTPDDTKSTVSELEAKKAALEAEIEAQRAAEKASVIDQIKTVVKSFNISTEELVEALGGLKFKRKGAKAKPKYRDPATGAIWSGRGKAPLWIRDKDYEQFRIPAEEVKTLIASSTN